MPQLNLPEEERKRRAAERSAKANAKAKLQRSSDKANGIKPKYTPLSEERKEAMRIYARERRSLIPSKKRVKLTDEELIRRRNKRQREYYKKRKPDAVPRVPKPKPVKMEKILKARPANRISEKVIKPVKMDHAKQDVCNIKPADPNLVRVKLNEKTWVEVLPGYDIDALRRKYLRV